MRFALAIVAFSAISVVSGSSLGVAEARDVRPARDYDATLVEKAYSSDASSDRGLFMSRADTLESGEVSISSYEFLFLGAGIGLTDDLQLNVMILAPVFEDEFVFGVFGVKGALYRGNDTVLAFSGSAMTVVDGNDSGGFLGGGVHLDRHVADFLSLHGTMELKVGLGEDFSGAVFPIFTGGAAFRLGEHVQLLTELMVPLLSDTNRASEVLSINYGMRLHNSTVAADVGFLFLLDGDDPIFEPIPIGLPFVALSLRF